MINDMNIVHEGVIKDIVDLLTNNDLIKRNKLLNTKQTYFSSISKASSNLVMTFPVLVDDSVPLSTARLISKAVEHKMVTMLQMLFSAIDITNNKNAFEFIGKIHKNLTSDDLISFINKMDSVPLKSKNESAGTAELDIEAINKYMIECMQSDNVYLKTGFNESLNDTWSVGPGMTLIQEAKNKHRNEYRDVYNDIYGEKSPNDHFRKVMNQWHNTNYEKTTAGFRSFLNDRMAATEKQKVRDRLKDRYGVDDKNKPQQPDKPEDIDPKEEEKRRKTEEKLAREEEKRRNKSTYNAEQLSKMVVSSDVKKVNEEVPSLMIINFRTKDENNTIRSAVVGVKAKIIYVTQNDVIDRIITKNNDNNGLFNFLRATTGEISMLKDFVFAINKAKFENIQSRPNTSPIWKMLERRYIMNKKNWLMSSYNGSGTAIAVLVVSKETIDRLASDYGFKAHPSKLLEIMEAYSIMGFIITDDIKEQVLSLYDDNSTDFELLSYSAYEKEDKLQYKKIINLITGAKE